MFEKLNMRCFNREVGILDALFLIIGKDFQLTVSYSDYGSLGTGILVYFSEFFRVFYEYSRNARRVLWKLARETHAPEDQFPQRNQHGDGREVCDTCVVKLDPKWHYLDLRNSNLISIGNLTHSLTLGFIYGLNIHGCGMAEVVKIVWGKPKLMFN